MSIPAGEREWLVAFERPAQERSAMGREPTQLYDRICRAWAKVRYGTGQERRQAGAEGATQTITVRVEAMPSTRLVTERDTIWLDGRRWDIAGVAPIGRDDIEFTATASKG